MDLSILSLGIALSIPGPIPGFDRAVQEPGQVVPDSWSCQPLVWDTKPDVDKNGLLTAAISAKCTFDGLSGGGFPELNTYLNDRVVQEAQTVHKGPTDVEYQGLPGTQYDVSVQFGKEDNRATVRQDAFIATDSRTKLLFSTFSTRIQGNGMAQYLKKVNVETLTEATDVERKYNLTLKSLFQLQKPWFAPKDTFINEVKTQIEQRAGEMEKQLIEDISQHIL